MDQASPFSATGVLSVRMSSDSMKEGENLPSSPTYAFCETALKIPMHSI